MSAPRTRARTRVRSGIDVGAMSSAVARPGIDPRIWLATAIVTDLGFDADEGPFVDIQYQPSGQNDTALVGSAYAGAEFGDWCGLEVDDTVLVAVPMGDPGNGPIVIARMWNAGDKPFAEMGDGDSLTANRVIRVKSGSSFQVVINGDGSLIELTKVGAEQSFVRGQDLKSATDAFADAVKAFGAAAKVSIVALGGELVTTSLDAAVVQFKEAVGNALSTKIKGE